MQVNLSLSFVMEKVDLVMVGAEGVAESGGIINKVSASICLLFSLSLSLSLSLPFFPSL